MLVGSNGDHQYGAILGTGMKRVNAIPAVCEARPGVLSSLPPMMGPSWERDDIGRSDQVTPPGIP